VTVFNSPFDFVKNITFTKEKINNETFEESKKSYIPFIVNRSLSYHFNCVFFANEINMNAHIDSKFQYDFYFHTIKKSKRYAKWCKPPNMEELKAISQKYKCNLRRAKEIFHILHCRKR
jgi:hypothetical protein